LANDPLAITSPLAELPDDALITWFHVQMGGKISGMLFFSPKNVQDLIDLCVLNVQEQ